MCGERVVMEYQVCFHFSTMNQKVILHWLMMDGLRKELLLSRNYRFERNYHLSVIIRFYQSIRKLWSSTVWHLLCVCHPKCATMANVGYDLFTTRLFANEGFEAVWIGQRLWSPWLLPGTEQGSESFGVHKFSRPDIIYGWRANLAASLILHRRSNGKCNSCPCKPQSRSAVDRNLDVSSRLVS